MNRTLTLTFVLLAACATARAQDLAGAATRFLASLDDKQKAKASYVLDDPERFNWHFVPRTRNGLNLRQMTAGQRDAALALLKASLSQQGFTKATDIMALENILKVIEHRTADDNHRDPLNYFITVFGTPSKETPWFWRFEGHHVAINFSCQHNELVSSTPNFWGSNPGIVLDGPEKGKQVLQVESDLGFQLMNSFTNDQKKTALIGEQAPPEIITGNDVKAKTPTPGGIQYSAMTTAQQGLFMKLLNVYVRNYEFGFSERLMKKIRDADINALSFAWAGSLQPGTANYYRIQNAVLLIEFDNTQNNANHIHTVVRDLTNDFAEDILREHYRKEH